MLVENLSNLFYNFRSSTAHSFCYSSSLLSLSYHVILHIYKFLGFSRLGLSILSFPRLFE